MNIDPAEKMITKGQYTDPTPPDLTWHELPLQALECVLSSSERHVMTHAAAPKLVSYSVLYFDSTQDSYCPSPLSLSLLSA